ncbi:MAG: PIN domain-containing protein [Patescibacteria group bacterium]
MKEYKYFIDTNVFIRVITADIKKQFQDSYSFLESVKTGKNEAYISSLVIAEINWILSKFYKLSKEEVIMKLNGVLGLKNLKIIDDVDPVFALKMFQDHSVKFIDAMIASNSLVSKGEMIIVSYDRDFDKMGVKRIEPADLI